MPTFYTVPKELIGQWDKAKKDLPTAIDKLKVGNTMITADSKKEMKKQVEQLLGQIDLGLKAKMKVAADAKDWNTAVKAAGSVATIASEYRKRIAAVSAPWGAASGRSLVEALDKVLVQIHNHAEAAAKGRPPVQPPKELAKIFQDGMAKTRELAGKVAFTDADDKRQWLKDVDKLIDNLGGPKLGIKVTSLANAKSEAEMKTAANMLSANVDPAYRLMRQWVTEQGKKAEPIFKHLDFLIRKIGQETKALQAKLA